ncbi:MAG: FtsW/RodA/SpoVE family cell cycle protein [Verrucomicrobia bacterium]|nr:FtsW/RodA/SpoVE family cell cycle protein [Verrucomicrobiota bacterium]
MARSRASSGPASGHDFLLVVAFLVLLGGWSMIMASRFAQAPLLRASDLVPLGALGAALLCVRWVLAAAGYRGDRIMVPLTLLLAGLGLLIQFRLGHLDFTDATRSSTYAYPLGLLMWVVTWMAFRQGRYDKLARLAIPALLLAAAVLGAILLLGQRFRGAVYLAGQVNPAELVKLLLAVFLAGMMAEFGKPLRQTVAGIPAPPLGPALGLSALWAIPMILLILQRDLGMIILLNVVLLVMVFMATGKWGYLALGALAAVAASYAGFQLFAHARERFLAWQDPFLDPTGGGWQILQSLSAMFSGGMWGSGLGSGNPTAVPIAASDFVYAAIAEELGFVGCALLIAVYSILFHRGYRIADQIRSPFGQTLAAALTTLLAVQTLMNIGGVTKAIPLTGIPLPLISHGGSSLVTTLMMLGLLTALSEPEPARRPRAPRAKPASPARRRVRATLFTCA